MNSVLCDFINYGKNYICVWEHLKYFWFSYIQNLSSIVLSCKPLFHWFLIDFFFVIYGNSSSKMKLEKCLSSQLTMIIHHCVWSCVSLSDFLSVFGLPKFSISVDLLCLLAGISLPLWENKASWFSFHHYLSFSQPLVCFANWIPGCWRVVEDWFNICFVSFLFCGSTTPSQSSLKKISICFGTLFTFTSNTDLICVLLFRRLFIMTSKYLALSTDSRFSLWIL